MFNKLFNTNYKKYVFFNLLSYVFVYFNLIAFCFFYFTNDLNYIVVGLVWFILLIFSERVSCKYFNKVYRFKSGQSPFKKENNL